MLIDAYMNHGRWVADCPGECGFSALVAPRPGLVQVFRLFSAISVARVNNFRPTIKCPAHGRRTVRFPIGMDEIEAILSERPIDPIVGAKHANWRPGETVESLRIENTKHEVSI